MKISDIQEPIIKKHAHGQDTAMKLVQIFDEYGDALVKAIEVKITRSRDCTQKHYIIGWIKRAYKELKK